MLLLVIDPDMQAPRSKTASEIWHTDRRAWRICSTGRTEWPLLGPCSATSPGALAARRRT